MVDSVKSSSRRVAKSLISAPAVILDSRQSLIETSQKAALENHDFRSSVSRGDELRNQQRWIEAEAAYADALARFPYERTFWVQLGHMAKEQEEYGRAETAYRTACALGAPVEDVLIHLRHVMWKQEVDEGLFPVRFYRPGSAASQPPARPDILMFARLLWRVRGVAEAEILILIRQYATCDALFAGMCSDSRFERANRDWLEVVREDEL